MKLVRCDVCNKLVPSSTADLTFDDINNKDVCHSCSKWVDQQLQKRRKSLGIKQ